MPGATTNAGPAHARVARAASVFAYLAVISVALVACVPADPISAPIAMTVADGVVTFEWCGKPTIPLRYLQIEYRTLNPDSGPIPAVRGDGRMLRAAR